MYAICFMAQNPVLPYIVKKLGADQTAYGNLMSTFSIIQVIGGLLCGPLIDKFGGKKVLLLSFASSAVCYAITAMSTNMTLLYLSRIPTLFQHAMLAGKAIITNLSGEKERTVFLSYTGVAYGIGFAIGPFLGGLISEYSLSLLGWCSCAGSIISCILIAIYIPDKLVNEHELKKEEKIKNKEDNKSNLKNIIKMFEFPHVSDYIIIKTLSFFGFAIFQSTFSLITSETFKLVPKQNGQILSFVGIISIVTQTLIINIVIRKFNENTSVKYCIIGLISSFFMFSQITEVWQLLTLLVPICSFGMLMANFTTSRLTKLVPQTLSGTMIAVEMSIGSGMRIISPQLGSYLLKNYGFQYIGYSITGIYLLLGLFLILKLVKLQQDKDKDK